MPITIKKWGSIPVFFFWTIKFLIAKIFMSVLKQFWLVVSILVFFKRWRSRLSSKDKREQGQQVVISILAVNKNSSNILEELTNL